ncbi:olfactory receptor 10A4-like [Alligator mississippiensis]|uniref:olfactory receptor 10A4-like n=1 Tax=Alligator mississippiensis TaxID=8496 RepID=UPI002877C091|nr:olfactory receptor 10A4-like [Alligator mississippiensis]
MASSERDTRVNRTVIQEFILVGFSYLAEMQSLVFLLFLVTYIVTLLGNFLIILLIKLSPSLHTPMYFFLVNLSFLDICFTTSVVPQMLVHLLVKHKSISIAGCISQLCAYAIVGVTECCLLASMAYDRYVAICHPLHYTTIMSGRKCVSLAAASWITSISVQLIQITWIFTMPFCGSNLIDHFFCDFAPLAKLACADTSKNEILIMVVTVLFIMGPFLLIILSYIHIMSTIFKLPSAEGRRKAFSTCSSHLMVVMLFYGTILLTYLRPKSRHTPEGDKVLSLIYTAITPALNPLIYTLRNKEVKGAFRKAVKGISIP